MFNLLGVGVATGACPDGAEGDDEAPDPQPVSMSSATLASATRMQCVEVFDQWLSTSSEGEQMDPCPWDQPLLLGMRHYT